MIYSRLHGHVTSPRACTVLPRLTRDPVAIHDLPYRTPVVFGLLKQIAHQKAARGGGSKLFATCTQVIAGARCDHRGVIPSVSHRVPTKAFHHLPEPS